MWHEVVALQVWFERTVRIGLISILLAATFQPYAYSGDDTVHRFYRTLLRIACCAVLFSFGMVLKTLGAKMLSSNFNKNSFFDKMQDALRKVKPSPWIAEKGSITQITGLALVIEDDMQANKVIIAC